MPQRAGEAGVEGVGDVGVATKYRRRRRGGLCEGVGVGHKVQESQELGDEGVTSFLDSNLGEPKFINIP